MVGFVGLPLVAVLVIVVVGSRWLDRLRPAAAARGVVTLLSCLLIAAVPTVWVVGLSGLAHTGLHNPLIDWSRHLLPEYEPAGAIIGIVSLLVALTGSARAGRVLALHRRIRSADGAPVQFVEADEIFAYTLPGPSASIAISEGLCRSVGEEELDVVVAHERAHGRFRHDRFKLVGLLAIAFVPPVRSVVARLDHHLERWADEEALIETGADRRLAARTIAKVALAVTSPAPALGVADRGVAARTLALLEPIATPTLATRVTTRLVVVSAVVVAAYQLHHSLVFAAGLMP